MEVKGSVVLITGASSGIGRAAALLFAREGARVMLSARRQEMLEAAAKEIRDAGGEADIFVADVGVESEAVAMVEATVKRFGRLDILVNNAGFGHFLPLSETTNDDFHRIMNVNLFGTIYATKAALPGMLHRRSGHIINVSSVAGKRVFRKSGGAYNTTKFAMQGYSEALRMELEGTGVRVSTVCPVVTATQFFDRAEAQLGRPVDQLGSAQSAEQVARSIVRLVSRPRPEVVMVGALRLLFAVNALSPRLVDRLILAFLGSRNRH